MLHRANKSKYFHDRSDFVIFGVKRSVFFRGLLALALTLLLMVGLCEWAELRQVEKVEERTMSEEEAAEVAVPAAWLDRLFRHGDLLMGGYVSYDVTEDSVDFFSHKASDLRYHYDWIAFGAEAPDRSPVAGSGVPGVYMSDLQNDRRLLSIDAEGRLAVQRGDYLIYAEPTGEAPTPERIMGLLPGGDLSWRDLQLILTAVQNGNLIGCHDGVAWWLEKGDGNAITVWRLTADAKEKVCEGTADSQLPYIVIGNTALMYEEDGFIELLHFASGSITPTNISMNDRIIAYNYCYRGEDVVAAALTEDKVLVVYYRPGEVDFDYLVYDEADPKALNGSLRPSVWVGIGALKDGSEGVVVYYGNGENYGNREWIFAEDQ